MPSAVPLDNPDSVGGNTSKGDAAGARQWLCFPEYQPAASPSAMPQPFVVVVESAWRRIAVVKLELRLAPGPALAHQVAELIDDRALALASRERLAGEFGERHGITLEFLDLDLDRDTPSDWPAIISRRVVQASLAASAGGAQSAPLSELRNSAVRQLGEEWVSAIAGFVANLSADAVGRAREAGGVKPSSYNYLNGVSRAVPAEGTPEGTVRRVRRTLASVPGAENQSGLAAGVNVARAQALAVFPFLQHVITRPEFDTVRSAIDRGGRLVDALADHFGVRRGIVRTLRGLTANDLGRWTYDIQTLLKALGHIPPDWWPRDPEAWRRFVTTVDTIARTTRHPISTSSNLLWLHETARNGFTLTMGDAEEMTRIGREIDEFHDALRLGLVWTVRRSASAPLSLGIKPIQITSRLKRELGLVKVSEIARRYGEAYRRATLRFAEEAELLKGVRWPAIGGGVATYGVVDVVPLLTPDELMAEGVRMRNCVASYVQNCATGKCQIWAVVSTEGLRLSTLETRISHPQSSPPRLVVAQHKGSGNGPVSRVAEETVTQHVNDLTGHPFALRDYLEWKKAISRAPLSDRQREALIVPSITALEEVLPKKWSFERLLGMVAKPG